MAAQQSHAVWHGWIGGASKFTMPFTLLEYVVRVANNIRSKFSEFSIDYNTNLPKMAKECTSEVTSRQFLTALREKGHWSQLHPFYSHSMSWTPVGIVHAQSILTHPQTVWRRSHDIWTKNLPPDMTSLESSLLDMHVALSSIMLEEFCDGRGFCKRFSWLCAVLVLS